MRYINRRHQLSLYIAVLSGLCAHLPVLAQSIPSQVNPGNLISPGYSASPLNERLENPMMKEQQERPRIDVPEQPAIVQVDKETFTANRIEVSGNRIISESEMRKIVAPYEGRELSVEDLAKIVSRINDEYRTRGFLTSMAFVPPQDLERGVITIKVLEGIVGDMEIAGNKYFKAKVIEKRIAEKPGDPLNIPKLEKELLRINRQEPYRLKATLSPGEESGETKIHLDVQEQQPFQIALRTDNMGRPYIGRYRAGVDLIDRNVTGHGDRFIASYLIGARQQIASASYTLPVGSKGTEVSGLFGFSHVRPDFNVRNQPEIIGNSYNYGLLVSQPLDIERRFTADFGFSARRVSTFINGDKDKGGSVDIRSLALGLNYNNYDRYGRTFARLQGTFAPEWLGANTSFFKLESYLTRVVRLPKSNLLVLRSFAQWAPDTLPVPEQMQLGGENTVRGFTEGVMLGDRGYFVSAEWLWPVPGLGHLNPWLGRNIKGAFFVDHGQSFLDKDYRYYSLYKNRPNSLTSVGFGVRAHLTDYLQGYVDVGFGLGDRKDVEPMRRQPTARLHFGVRSELLPNDYKTRDTKVTPIKADVFRPRSVGALQEGDMQSEISDPTLEPVEHLNTSRVY
jgi:hemolysin activation/secretion protein